MNRLLSVRDYEIVYRKHIQSNRVNEWKAWKRKFCEKYLQYLWKRNSSVQQTTYWNVFVVVVVVFNAKQKVSDIRSSPLSICYITIRCVIKSFAKQSLSLKFKIFIGAYQNFFF